MELPTRQVDMLANWRVSEVDLRLAELHIYGNSAGGRIGMYMLPRYDEDSDPSNDHLDNRVTTELAPDLTNGDIYVRQLTQKRYEMKDHLGNVRVVISDLKAAPSGRAGPWAADILSWNNYYPFGMAQPDRHGNTEKYRYGFNGMEMDNEVKENPTTGTSGVGNHYDYGARGYDPRSGRWWSVDPLFKKYPSISSYTYVANNPILYVDQDGKEIWIYYQVIDSSGSPVIKKVQYKNGALYEASEAAYTGTNAYVTAVKADLDAFRTDHPEAAHRLKVLETSTQIHKIENTSGNNSNTPASGSDDRAGVPTGTTTKYDPTNWTRSGGARRTPRVGLAHEFLGHAYDSDQGQSDYGVTGGIVNYEISAVNAENLVRSSTGEALRTTYGSSTIPAANLNDPTKYTIRSGDTLSGIAKSAGTSVANLQKLNPSITDLNKINTGDVITIR
ncbi:MAG: LysM peptidoglycan-binding domain-containing protein [Chlorobi bacterium]|nr:LysM peptidoglycan-binding domain-containing protein [Chlorobiota bacterium]